jgi:hypothetical protein
MKIFQVMKKFHMKFFQMTPPHLNFFHMKIFQVMKKFHMKFFQMMAALFDYFHAISYPILLVGESLLWGLLLFPR